MRNLLYTVLAAALVISCGSRPDAMETFRQNQRKPHAVSVNAWDGSDVLAQHKQAIVNSCRSRGANDAATALVLAMAMQESNNISACERDASKDGTASMNFSALNLNQDCLQRLGWVSGQGPDLNQDSGLDSAVGYVLQGFGQFGQDGMLNIQRGGAAALADGVSYGAQAYRDQMRAVQVYLLQNRDAWINSQKIGGFLVHV